MMGIIGIFFPSIFGMFMLEQMDNKWKLNIKEYCYIFSMLVLFSNLFAFIISRFLWKIENSIFSLVSLYPMFFVKYVVILLILNFLLAIAFILIKKQVNISIEVK